MNFIHQLVVDLDRKSKTHDGGLTVDWPKSKQQLNGVPNEVLKFAPKKLRLQCAVAEDRVQQLENEISEWRTRAGQAELRLQSIEKVVQEIAAKYTGSLPTK